MPNEPKQLRPIGGRPSGVGKANEVHLCYHCEAASKTVFCENWRVWTCSACLTKHHRVHHTTCAVVLPKNTPEQEAEKPKFFVVHLKRYDGKNLQLQCRLGQKLEMEDHWMGTYIFAPGGIVLVSEKRDEINEKILLGLKTAA